MNLIGKAHDNFVHGRRVQKLCAHLSEILPDNATVLDVGCGDGWLSSLIAQKRPDIRVSGVDVLIRGVTKVPVEYFDGVSLPFPDASFDVVMFVDVLHHTKDPAVLLAEAQRVSRTCIVIKDHTRNGLLAGLTLRFMDWLGNAHHGVALPYNYWSKEEWDEAIQSLGLISTTWIANLDLYPFIADLFFGRSLHFVARLDLQSR